MFTIRRATLAIPVLLLAAGCGGGDGGTKSDPLTAKGYGGGYNVSNSILDISMPVDASLGLAEFATKAKEKFGDKLKEGHFKVDSASISFDITSSKGIQYFKDAFSGAIQVKIKPTALTTAGVVIGSVTPSAHDNGTLKIGISTGTRELDNIKDEILGATLAFEAVGPTNWNSAETRKIGLIIEMVLEAVVD